MRIARFLLQQNENRALSGSFYLPGDMSSIDLSPAANNGNSRKLVWHLVSRLVFIDAPRVVAVTLIKQLVAEPLKTLELLCML